MIPECVRAASAWVGYSWTATTQRLMMSILTPQVRRSRARPGAGRGALFRWDVWVDITKWGAHRWHRKQL